jgi:YfiR/HmsC-like
MKRFLVTCALICLVIGAKAQDRKISSLFVYNFVKYIEWPTDPQKNEFVVGVAGNEEALKQFKTTLDGRPKGSQKIVVRNLADVTAQQCHLIFVTGDRMAQLEKIKQETSGLPIVIVTEKEGALKNGSTINMVQKNGKMGFEILEPPKSSKLKFSSEILRLAKS